MQLKKIVYSLIALVLVFSFVLPPVSVLAESEWDKLDREIQQLQQQKEASQKAAEDIKKQISGAKQEQSVIRKELEEINKEITKSEQSLFKLERQIADTTIDAKAAAEELEEAEDRVADRDELLKTRVRLMYKNGSVGYLELLLNSTSFSDFIQRFNTMKKIVAQDKSILDDNIRDKNIIADKKEQIDTYLASLEQLFTETEELKASLRAKKEKQQYQMTALNEKVEELNGANAEEEKIIMELAAAQSKLINEKRLLQFGGGKFIWPVPESTRITSEFGVRYDPFTGVQTGHTGIDIGRPDPNGKSLQGADILAAADGVVILASYVNGYGNTVMIDHGSGIWTLYGHIRNGGIMVKVGQAVARGDKIAEVGSTGRSTGPHLHFEVREDNKAVSPWKYLNG
jgi:murein DD-endopeptidase MepM/ murein hydrolase activator NlpD